MKNRPSDHMFVLKHESLNSRELGSLGCDSTCSTLTLIPPTSLPAPDPCAWWGDERQNSSPPKISRPSSKLSAQPDLATVLPGWICFCTNSERNIEMAGAATKAGLAHRNKPNKPVPKKAETKTLKRKRDQEDLGKLRKAVDELVSGRLIPLRPPRRLTRK
jgi:hypothetical protein